MVGNMRMYQKKLNYRSPEGTILKYSHYCIEKNVEQSLLIIMKI